MKFYAHYERHSGYYYHFVAFTDDYGDTVSIEHGIAHTLFFTQVA